MTKPKRLFDEKKFDYLMDKFLRDRSVQYQYYDLDKFHYFINSEILRIRDEAVKEFANEIMPEDTSNDCDGEEAKIYFMISIKSALEKRGIEL